MNGQPLFSQPFGPLPRRQGRTRLPGGTASPAAFLAGGLKRGS